MPRMRGLILSDITEMGTGLCVIGVEQVAQDSFRSVRPLPPRGYAWNKPFPHTRGNAVLFESAPTLPSPPHGEDQNTYGLRSGGQRLSESELVSLLKRAEVSADLEGL